MIMKLLIDMNLSPKLVDMFTNKGIKTNHWYKIGKLNAPDTEILSYAKQNNFIILTCDLDFSAILSATHDLKPSVIQLRLHKIDYALVVELVYMAIMQNSDDLMKGAILSIDTGKARLRILPL